MTIGEIIESIENKVKNKVSRLERLAKTPNYVVLSAAYLAGLSMVVGSILVSFQTGSDFFSNYSSPIPNIGMAFALSGLFLFLPFSLLSSHAKFLNTDINNEEKKSLAKELKACSLIFNLIFFLTTVAGALWVLVSADQGSILTFCSIIGERLTDKLKEKYKSKEAKFQEENNNIPQGHNPRTDNINSVNNQSESLQINNSSPQLLNNQREEIELDELQTHIEQPTR